MISESNSSFPGKESDPKNGDRVLVVEDELCVCELFLHHLDRFSCEPFLAQCGSEANALISRFSFSVVILDINLPDGNGLSFAEKWVQEGFAGKIVLTTATKTTLSEIPGGFLQIDDFLPKPFNYAEIDQCLSKFLRKSSAARERPISSGISSQDIVADGLLRTEGLIALIQKDRGEFLKIAHRFTNISFALGKSDAASHFALAEEFAKKNNWTHAEAEWTLAWN